MKFAQLVFLLSGATSLLHGEPLPATSSAIASASPTNQPGDPISEVLPILQADYSGFPALNYHPGDTLPDLVARSNGRIQLEPANSSTPVPIFSASLPDNIGYWRLASFTPQKDWSQVASELKTMSEQAQGEILDLRANGTTDYAGAAQILRFFAPSDNSLYRYSSDETPSLSVAMPPSTFPGTLVVLINSQTAGAAETLAGRLQADGALVVGQTTASALPPFEDHKLADGQVLRIVLSLKEGHAATPSAAVIPDIALNVDERNEKAALTLIRDDRIDDVIQETTSRPRLSEAALVAGEDPEWDAYLEALERKPVLLSLPRIHDPVLTAALDSVRAIRLSERAVAGGAAADPATTAPPPAGSMQ